MFVICNDPTEYGDVFMVSISTARENDPQVDKTCLLEPHDYVRVTRTSFVYYSKARVVKETAIRDGIESGRLAVLEDLNAQTALRVVNGIGRSDRIAPKLVKAWEAINRQSDSSRQKGRAQ